MADELSQRVLEQRYRNRIMEQMWSLARGEEAIREDPIEYVESFYDWFPSQAEGSFYPKAPDQWKGLATLSPAEDVAVRVVLGLMIAATEKGWNCDAEEAIANGWPQRIAPHAQRALDLMLARGRFDEENEEAEPSTPVPWPPV
jgi:hypothetical protein